MDDRTPIQKVRYSVEQADKARKLANDFSRMHDALTRHGDHTIRVRVKSFWQDLSGAFRWRQFEMTDDEARHLSEWFYLREQQELRRAEAYDQEALKVIP